VQAQALADLDGEAPGARFTEYAAHLELANPHDGLQRRVQPWRPAKRLGMADDVRERSLTRHATDNEQAAYLPKTVADGRKLAGPDVLRDTRRFASGAAISELSAPENRLPPLAIHRRDVTERDALRADRLALALVGAGAKALGVHPLRHGDDTCGAFDLA